MNDAAVAGGTGHNSSSRRKAGSPHGATPLMYACQQGDVAQVRHLIRAQPNLLRDIDRTGKSSLHYCCTSDSVFAVQAADLVAMAAPDLVESRDEDGFTPLHLAVIAGNLQLVNFLLANKADVRALDNEKHTVVHWATVCGETGSLRAVIAAGAPVSTPDVHGGYPLHYAAQMCGGEKGSALGLQVLHALLAQPDVDVTVEDGDGRQPLLWAASAGSARAVLALVRAGAKVEAPDRDGLTALHCAASRGHTDCIDTLLTLCGASPDVIDSNGCTALHYAVTLGHADATALLLNHGSDANRQDRKGRSPAHCGCAKGQFETLKMLSNHGANLWLRNARGDLPLHEAAASGRRDLVRWLLDFRPSQVNARNNDGRCPLHLAALHDNPDMCKILLDIGAQINPVLRTSKNVFMTPLDCALQRGFRSTAKYLQLHGGVPASRLGGLRQAHPANSASLQIREDITFWDNTSSENEEDLRGENKRSSRTRKKSYRKRTVFDKKVEGSKSKTSKERAKDSLSGSEEVETEIGKDAKRATSKKHTSASKSEVLNKDKSISSGHEITFQHENGDILIKSDVEITNNANGVVIQRKDGICISGGTAKSVKDNLESSLKDEIAAKAKEVTDTKVAASNNKRPKSAKNGKTKRKLAKSPRAEEKSPPKDASRKSPPVTLVDKSVETNRSSAKTSKVDEGTQMESDRESRSQKVADATNQGQQETEGPDAEKVAEVAEMETQTSLEGKPKDDTEKAADNTSELPFVVNPDRQSLLSNYSNDEAEAVKNLIVEAAVHPPPKDVSAEPEGAVNASQQPVALDNDQTKDAIKETEASLTKETIDQTGTGTAEEVGQAQDGNKVLDVGGEHLASGLEQSTEEQSALEGTEVDESKTEEGPAMVVLSGPETEGEQSEQKREPSFVVVDENEDTKKGGGSLEDRQDLSQSITDTDNVSFDTVINVNDLNEKSLDISDGDKSAIAAILLDNDQDESLQLPGQDAETKSELGAMLNDTEEEPKDTENYVSEVENDKGLVLVLDESGKPVGESSQEAGNKSLDEDSNMSSSSQSSLSNLKAHKSFQVLEEGEEFFDQGIPKTPHKKFSRKSKPSSHKPRSKSEDPNHELQHNRAVTGMSLKPSKSSSIEDERLVQSSMDGRVTSLPRIYDKGQAKSETNISTALLHDGYSDNERGEGSGSDVDGGSPTRIRRLKKRSKSKGPKSAGSDYESSNLIDSGFEPSPRSSRIPKKKNMTERGVNMTSVTQTIQSNIRRYHLERRIFQHLLELKRIQIRSGIHNEGMLVKRAIDAYHRSCVATVGAGRYNSKDFTFKSFEKFLYEALRKLQKNGSENLRGLPETPDHPLLCTQSTHRCPHATHAYTGIPCAAYIPKMNHHHIPKVGFNVGTRQQQSFLPKINSNKGVTLELCHGIDKQVISLPAERLDQNKRYYVTFTVKGQERQKNDESTSDENAHSHAKSV